MNALWKAKTADGRYQNPILFADYSDPDVIRVGSDYFMVASSFTYLPGVPVLHSTNLVDWERIGYCVKELPFERYNRPAHGAGTWAPSIRWHDGTFYVFIPMPDEGIFVTTAKDPWGEWTPLHCIKEAKGWIDPCPLWDEDGKAYMVFAYAKSRCGIKHKLSVCEISLDARRILSEPRLVYDGTQTNPTLEGPKFYKRNGWYYLFAPAGGVETGWQTVLRSRDVYGPYEYRIVLHEGGSGINGPHQGGWVEDTEGKDWFVHFQDAGAYGRVLHLQPMCWNRDWPFMGTEQNGDGIGEPVEDWELPPAANEKEKTPKPRTFREGNVLGGDDEFASEGLSLAWQWQANPREEWYSTAKRPGWLRLYTLNNPAREQNLLWYMGNVCTQLLQAPEFTATALLEGGFAENGDMAGMGILGHLYTWLALEKTPAGQRLALYRGNVRVIQAEGEAEESLLWETPVENKRVWLRLSLETRAEVQGEQKEPAASAVLGQPMDLQLSRQKEAKSAAIGLSRREILTGGIGEHAFYHYSYSLDGETYLEIPGSFPLKKATWTGGKFFLAARNRENVSSQGYGEFDYVRFDAGRR